MRKLFDRFKGNRFFMNTFSLYFELGYKHILDINGVDHILFIISLCSVFLLRDWKRVLILVTAFTVGHSITLALAVFDIVRIKSEIIEFLIPVTIFITAFINLFKKQPAQSQSVQLNYIFALFFGLIHGLGFSNYLKALLGKQSIGEQLLAFNLGIEAGQILIVSIFLLITFIFISICNVNRRDWNLIISSAIAGVALTMMFDTKFW